MAEKRLFKEYNQVIKQHPSRTNHQILSLQPLDPDNIFKWEAVICKPTKQDSKYYYNGKWKLNISVGNQYPIAPPTIAFDRKTPINHPNINFDTGEICLDILKSENWSPAWNLQHLVVAILMLIDDPEPDSPLNIDLANLFRSDKQAFESYVQYTMWKYNTFHEVEKNPTGLKAHDIDINDSPKPVLSSSTHEDGHRREDSESNVEIIKDVGKQITQEFIDKVDEIKHSKETSLDKIEYKNYSNAKRQIVENVNKQVEELCSKSVSPVNEPVTINQEVDEIKIDPVMEDERKKFLLEVDMKVNKYQERNQAPKSSDESVNTITSGTKEVGTITDSNTLGEDDYIETGSKASKSDTDLSTISTNSSLNRLKKSLSIKHNDGAKGEKKKSKRDRLKKMVNK